MKDLVGNAFAIWRQFCDSNAHSDSQGQIQLFDLQNAFLKVSLEAPLDLLWESGAKYGFPGCSIINIIALHGGYFRLLQAGLIKRSDCRFLDSLYHPTFPSLKYNTNNSDINAPWITLSAQEALLDIALDKFLVVEYGSGISTFFFSRESKKCFSFEDDLDPAGQNTWSNQMREQAIRLDLELNLITPNEENVRPDWIISNLWTKHANLLVSIDGIDRGRHFMDWTKYLLENMKEPVILLVDNTDLGFREQFSLLATSGVSIIHHYGHVYGQLTNKQCTSICTARPDLLVSKSSSPADHDRRWGVMNFQDIALDQVVTYPSR